MTPNSPNNPSVSIVIPAYRNADFLNQALESIRGQTYSDYEIIIVDDGSGDDCVNRYELDDKTRLFRHDQSRGPAAARNTGIRESCGRFIAFLDQDDIWLPEKLQLQTDALEQDTAAGLTFCHYSLVDEALEPLAKQPQPKTIGRSAFSRLIQGNIIKSCSVVMLRREAIEKCGVFDENLSGTDDWDLWLRIAHDYKVCADPTPLVKYRVHPAQLSKDAAGMRQAELDVISKWLLWTKEKDPGCTRSVQSQLSLRLQRLATAEARRRQIQKSLSIYKNARSANPWDPRGYAWPLIVICASSCLRLLPSRLGRSPLQLVPPDPPCRANTGAVVVTFHPDADIAIRLQQIIGQVDRLLIVDNASSADEAAPLNQIVASGAAEIISNSSNLGVAAAINQGLRWAEQRGYAWLLTMDQDSLLFDDAVAKLATVYQAIGSEQPVAMIGCNFIDRHTDLPHYHTRGSELQPWKDVTTVITSGSLVSVAAASKLGEFLESLFIDHVDCEYCLRARANGLAVIRAHEPLMEHAIGHPVDTRCLWWEKRLLDVPPERWYYQSRNMLVLARMYWRTDGKWVRQLFRKRLRDLKKVVLYETHKRRKLRSMAEGVSHALRGKSGPREDAKTRHD